jgi:hypothetical protein
MTRLKDGDVIGPVVTECGELACQELARVLALATQLDPGMPGLVPAHAPVLGDRALQTIEQLIRALAGDAPLQVDRLHGETGSIADS